MRTHWITWGRVSQCIERLPFVWLIACVIPYVHLMLGSWAGAVCLLSRNPTQIQCIHTSLLLLCHWCMLTFHNIILHIIGWGIWSSNHRIGRGFLCIEMPGVERFNSHWDSVCPPMRRSGKVTLRRKCLAFIYTVMQAARTSYLVPAS